MQGPHGDSDDEMSRASSLTESDDVVYEVRDTKCSSRDHWSGFSTFDEYFREYSETRCGLGKSQRAGINILELLSRLI